MSGLASAIGRNRGRIAIALVLAVWLYFVIAFAEQAWRANELQAEVDAQRTAIAEMDRENAELETELDRMSSAAYYEYVQEIARRELGLANPGETVYLVRWNPEGTEVIPNIAEAQVDVRRVPGESAAEVFARFRRIINDNAVEITSAGGQQMPATEPSAVTTTLYQAIEKTAIRRYPKALVVPYMVRGATDGAFLRDKGMAVYGVPIFLKERESRAHGNDERIALANLIEGTELLWDIVLAVAANDNVRLD